MNISCVTDNIMRICSKNDEQRVCHATIFLYEQLSVLASKTPNVFVGYKQLESISKAEDITSDELISAVQILANPEINVLIIKYLYIDENENTHEIPYNEIIEAEKEKSLVHPVNGELIYDYKKHIFQFFSVNILGE
ncbi:hypothetical protein AB7378_20475 [Providencia rettgeri]